MNFSAPRVTLMGLCILTRTPQLAKEPDSSLGGPTLSSFLPLQDNRCTFFENGTYFKKSYGHVAVAVIQSEAKNADLGEQRGMFPSVHFSLFGGFKMKLNISANADLR